MAAPLLNLIALDSRSRIRNHPRPAICTLPARQAAGVVQSQGDLRLPLAWGDLKHTPSEHLA